MSRASRAKAIAQAAAVGGAGLVGAGGAMYGVLIGQSRLARRRIGTPSEALFDPSGTYGDDSLTSADPVRLALLGDSGAAGFGVDEAEDTTGAVIASLLAAAIDRPVQLQCWAVVGAQSEDLPGQIAQALPFQPHAAVIMVGANDVTNRVTPGRSVALLTDAVRQLLAADIQVVVGTCPDLGTVRPIPHPLKWIARHWSRSLAAAQTVAVVVAGGRTVALADLLGEEFDTHPDTMFGPDRFHPSAAGYRAVAAALVPSLTELIGDSPGAGSPTPRATTAHLAVERAAAAAVEVGGAEVLADANQTASASWHRRTLRAVLRRPPGDSVKAEGSVLG